MRKPKSNRVEWLVRVEWFVGAILADLMLVSIVALLVFGTGLSGVALLAGILGGLPSMLLTWAAVIWRTPPGAHPLLGVPFDEHRTLLATSINAITRARAGRIEEGYLLLMAALRRAESLRDGGACWADELIRRYLRTLDHYVSRYGTG
jgi:hypothetical protein